MATTTNFGWETPDDTDLVKDGALAMRTLGNAIDTSLVDLKGGTTGQVLSKTSNTDMDFTWVAVDPLTILDAKGDLITATAADTPARLAVGTNGQVLTADSTTSTGLKWATAGGGGKVLQVVTATTTTSTTIATQTDTDTGITGTITPTSASSTILILLNYGVNISATNNDVYAGGKLLRGATTISDFGTNRLFGLYDANSTNHAFLHRGHITYVDSPATTSATTYKLQARLELTPSGTGRTMSFQYGGSLGSITLLEIGA
jgi:hypothetical protein